MGQNSYVTIGLKEDINNLISNIDPIDTPLYTLFGTGVPATQFTHGWLEDAIAEPKLNSSLEFGTLSASVPVPRKHNTNYTQIFTQGYGVSGTQQASLKHGVADEMGYQMQKAMKEIKLDVEYAYITNAVKVLMDGTKGDVGGVIGAMSGTTRKLCGVTGFISTNEVKADGGVGVACYENITEDLLNDALQLAWQSGGKPKSVFVSGSNKRAISKFIPAGSVRNANAADKTIFASVDVYNSDWGLVRVFNHRMLPNTTILILDEDLWKTCFLRNFAVKELNDNTDGAKKVIIGELTLEAKSEQGNAKITGLKV